MHLFDFAGNSLDRAVLGADGAADAAFRNDVSFFAVSGKLVLNGFGGAHCSALTAIDAFGIIDTGKVVADSDCLGGAFFGTESAADAGMTAAAEDFGSGTLVLGGASDKDGELLGNE